MSDGAERAPTVDLGSQISSTAAQEQWSLPNPGLLIPILRSLLPPKLTMSERAPSKKVRIVSPTPTSPEIIGNPPNSLWTHGPPDQNAEEGSSQASEADSPLNESSPTDPFGSDSGEDDRSSSEGEDTKRNTERNQAMTARAPPNPFRTSPDAHSESEKTSHVPPKPLTAKAGNAAGRASLDVDAFKRLIMTGKAGPASSDQPSTPPGQPRPHLGLPGDGGSSTDTSSLSRQSIFEPLTGPPVDTPRTSHDSTISEDERQQLVESKNRPGEQRVSTSRARHNQSLAGQPPQTWSRTPPGSPSFSRQVSTTSPQSPDSPKDLNKPLPPPPASAPLQAPLGLVETGSEAPRLGSESSATLSPSRPGKIPPEVPLARRKSQRSSVNAQLTGTFSRSSVQSEVLGDADLRNRDSELTKAEPSPGGSKQPPPPPPPPSRRLSQRLATNSTSTLHGSPPPTKESTMSPSDAELDASATPHSTSRALPARTSSSASSQRSARLQSQSTSNESTPVSGSMAPPPPPPPRRHRGSRGSNTDAPTASPARMSSTKRSSFDPTSKPADSPTQSTLSVTDQAKPPESTADVMADLSALQREVDELRGKYEKSSNSAGADHA